MSVSDAERIFYDSLLSGDGTLQDKRYQFFLAGSAGAIPAVDPEDLVGGSVPVWNATTGKWELGAGGELGGDSTIAALVSDPNSETHAKLSATITSEVGDIVPPMVPPLVTSALADDDAPAQAAALAVADALEDWDRTGTGSPEGVVAAPVGVRYRDTNATNGAVLWVKATGTGNTGWQVVYGDTGWRNINSLIINGWVNYVYPLRLRRVNERIYVVGYLLKTDATSAVFLDVLGAGFAPAANTWHMGLVAGTATSAPVLVRLSGSGFQIPAYASSAVQPESYVDISYSTTDTWPASLPGTAI